MKTSPIHLVVVQALPMKVLIVEGSVPSCFASTKTFAPQPTSSVVITNSSEMWLIQGSLTCRQKSGNHSLGGQPSRGSGAHCLTIFTQDIFTWLGCVTAWTSKICSNSVQRGVLKDMTMITHFAHWLMLALTEVGCAATPLFTTTSL